jgi:uncharacterized delta-60 repeat protein
MRNRASIRPVLLFFFLLLISNYAVAQTLDLDPTFGANGQVFTDFPFASSNYSSNGRYIFVQPSGRIVGVGSHLQPGGKGNLPGVAAVGLTPAGNVDPGFSGGKTLEWQGFSSVFLHDCQMLPDGRILRMTSYISLGNGARTVKLVRTTADGVQDSFFADLIINPRPPSDPGVPNPIKFSVANDGKIYVLVRAYGSFDYYMIRLNPEGDRDPSYGTGGAKLLPTLSRLPEPKSIARIFVLPNGKVVMGGVTGGQGINQTEVFFSRIDSDGNTDRSFGRLGIMRHEFGVPVVMRDMLVQGDKYVIAGSIKSGDIDMLMVRSTGRGRLDYTFGNGGIVSDDYTPGGTDYAAAAALDANGRIVIAGEADQELASPSNFLLARYSADGVFVDGAQTAFSATFDAGAADLVIQPDGKIILIGYARNPNGSISGNVFAFARYTDITNDPPQGPTRGKPYEK